VAVNDVTAQGTRMPPINPLLAKNTLQAFTRIGQQAGKLATAAPGLAEKATGAARVAARQMSGLSGLAERLPSKLPTAATLQSGIAGLRPRLQNASLLGQMGKLGQGAPLGQFGKMGPMGNMGPMGQLNQVRHAVHSALERPMAAALKGSGHVSGAAGKFLQALHGVEDNALYQNFAPPIVAQMLGEATKELQAIQDMIQRFQAGMGRLGGGLKPTLASPSSRPTPPAGPVAHQPTPPLAIEPKPQPVSLASGTPAEAIQSLRGRGVDLKALQQDLRNYRLHSTPSREALIDKYKDDADLSIIDDGPKVAKFMLALNGAVRADAGKPASATPSSSAP
jgi:hypothetical protein